MEDLKQKQDRNKRNGRVGMKGRGNEWDARKSKQEQKAMRDMEELTCKEEVRNRVGRLDRQ